MNKKKSKAHLINREIKASQVRVADEGVMSLSEALVLAESKQMDLVLVSDKANPPVCKIFNYEKFLYELTKKPKPKSLDIKEIKFGPNTAQNDLDYRTKHIIEFLEKGHKVKLTLQFRGREMAYIDKGKEMLLKLVVAVEDYGILESMPNLEGKKMFATLRPKTKN